MENLQKTLEKFGKNVVTGAKRRVPSASRKLKRSISSKTKVSKKSFETSISMQDYGIFIDQGVKGVGGLRKYKDGKKLPAPIQWKRKKVINSPFSYKIKRPPSRVFSQWSVRTGIAPRVPKGTSAGGQFKRRKGLQFALAESVFRTGLKTTHFLTIPFNKEFKKLPEDLLKNYSIDVETTLGKSLDKI